MRFEPGRGRLAIDADRERCLALLSIACRRKVPASLVRHLEAASAHWQRGEPVLANLRLVFARLPHLEDQGDAARVLAAEYLLDAGMAPRALLKELHLDPDAAGLRKYDPNEPRVPAGEGDKSGEWTNGFWSRVRHWLEAQVPVYDQDTGIQVGTQSRARSIATNPLAVGAAGTAALVGGEAAAGALFATPPTTVGIAEAEGLLPQGVSRATFANLAGFAKGLSGSSEASTEATDEIVSGLQDAGVTQECIAAFQRFYAGVARDTPQNLSAIHRAELLSNIARRLK